MRVLLTGAAGFVGQPALEMLSRKHEVTAFDIRPVAGATRTVQGDVLDYKTVEAAVAGHDAVVNTIMAPNPTYGPGGPGFTINVSGLFNLLEAARTHGIRRFVHTSSGAVHSGYPPGTCLTNELYPLKAGNSYSLSKLLQEEMTRNFHEQHGMSIAVIRPWGIIDPDRMVTTDGSPVTGTHWGHIDRRDVAGGLAAALEQPDIAYECFYVMASPGGYKITDAARTESRLGWKPARTFDADL
jgi:nucleoside-diphosphate-sugar epimerase